MSDKIALITGITGQDGAYLSELLISKGYIVHGVKRRTSLFNTSRIDHLYQDPHADNRNFILHYGDLSDSSNIIRIIQDVRPLEIYNLGAMSHVKVSFDEPQYTANIDALGTLRILEAIRLLKLHEEIKFYQASSSELYGKTQETPQNEQTPFYPRSPYAVAKLYAHWITVNYREAYGIFACNGILFNHESPLRGETFVTRKITRAIAKISLGLQDSVYIGNLNAKRDWGHAKDYVEAMWRMFQLDKPEDFVIATGKATSIRDFAKMAFQVLDTEIEFSGMDENEVGIVKSTENPEYQFKIGDVVLRVDPTYYRPTEVDLLVGDSSKAKAKLDWQPKIDLRTLVQEMVNSDLELFRRDRVLSEAGYTIRNEFE